MNGPTTAATTVAATAAPAATEATAPTAGPPETAATAPAATGGKQAPRPEARGFLRAIGIAGWDALEAAILAALATESPLLLVGGHGSAKTLLLARLAEALGLVFRHYNASILSFDDLLGYPVPQDGRLVYLETPATIWQAEAVLFDEVSRCRPELQNKLFPLVHEKLAQGLPLPRLRHRWAAMNPPPADGSAFDYEGAEPLDVALADRFPFVLEAPTLDRLSEADRRAVLLGQGQPREDAAGKLRRAIDATKEHLPWAERKLRGKAAGYADVLAAQLAAAEHPLSTRRAVTLVRNIEAVNAAESALECEKHHLEDSFYAAARVSLPDAAWGRPVEGHVLLAAHKAAWQAAELHEDSPERALLAETDPLERIALALTLDLPPAEAGAVVADGFAALSQPERLVTSAVLFPRLARKKGLPATALEAVADAYAKVARGGSQTVVVRRGGQDWKRDLLGSQLAALDPRSPRDRVLQNVAAVLMADEEPFQLADLKNAWDRARRALRTTP
jgi:MoxR-like ATPase